MFSLQRTGSGRRRLDIISVAHAMPPAVGVPDPNSNSTLGEVGVRPGVERAGPLRGGVFIRVARSHARWRRSTYPREPRNPRPRQAFAYGAIMQSAHRGDLALSSGNVFRDHPTAHNRTLNIEAVMYICA